MKKLVIIGASGHGKVIADIAVKNGYEEIVFLDDDENIKECAGFPVVGKTSEAVNIDGDKIIAIGNAKIREWIQSDLENVVTLIHPAALISRRVCIGTGTVVMAGAVINSDAVIGDGCIINTGASVDHDCKIGNYSHISVGAHVAGTVEIGERTWIGAGATVSNNVNICNNCMIGAGAVVIKDIEEPGTYVGVPAEEK
ncbi:MAG: acetyltransferase [Oliverpabstia sp.]|nr:acetyltransferase [Oliverpabstia sp.]